MFQSVAASRYACGHIIPDVPLLCWVLPRPPTTTQYQKITYPHLVTEHDSNYFKLIMVVSVQWTDLSSSS
jgi:hypothetical protein